MPKDTLNSVQVLRLIDLLSEGPIEGFPSASGLTVNSDAYSIAALKDTFFNNTPVLGPGANVTSNSKITDVNITQELNFDMGDAIIQTRNGTQEQSFLDNVGDLNQRTILVNTELERAPRVGNNEGSFAADGTPVTRQITDTDVNQVRVTVGSPAISKFKKNGDVDGVKIKYKIEVRYSGGSFQQVGQEHTIDGFTPDLYQRRHVVIVDPAQAFPIDIRLTRTFQRYDDDDTINDDLVWYDYTEKIKETTRFPNSAVVGLKLDSEQFPNIPKRSYKIRGKKVRIPHNATVRADGSLSYSGTFLGAWHVDGVTKRVIPKWTTDPAWILYDLLTNTRYGLGSQILTPAELQEATQGKKDANGSFVTLGDGGKVYFDLEFDVATNLDIYSFQQASAYCGNLVDDGQGGKEPRFSCNILLQTQQDAYKLIQEMCSVFRAMSYWQSNGMALAQDRPEDFAYQFNQTNVTDAGFSYAGSSLRNRPTCVAVKYFDNDLRDHSQELVELSSTSFKPLQKYGYNKHSVTAFACTSRGQARRLGLWLLYTEHNESEVCSFETDMAAGITVRPGDFIKVADPVRAGKTVGGRVIDGSTTTSVKIDRSDVDMFGQQTPSTFTLNIVLRDGTMQVVGSSTISGNTITPGATLNKAPLTGAPFAIGYTGLGLSLWRVVTVEENESTYAVTALAHERDKYSVIEESHTFAPRDITQLAEKPDAVTNLALSEVLYEVGDKVLQRVNVNWQQSTRANEYEVVFKLDDNNPEKHVVTTTGFEIPNSNIGTYEVSVTAIGYGLDVAQTGKRRSSATTATINTVGKSSPPSNIAGLNITPIDQHTAELHWPEAVDLDVKIGGTVEIRHNPRTTGEIKWAESEKIVPAVNGSTTRKIVPLKDGHYLVRAKDSSGNYAPLAGIPSVLVELPEPQDLEVVQTYTESPSFPGTFSQAFNSVSEGGITLQADGLIDDIVDFDSVTNIDFFGNVVSVGSYIFANTLDLGAKYDVELLSNLKIRTINPDDFWDSRNDNIDTWDDIDADDLSGTNAELYVRSTGDDPSASPTFGTWEPFANSTKRGRGFQFKVEMETENDSQDPIVESLGVTVSLQRRTEQQRNISTTTSAKVITFPSAFYSVPSVTVTATNMATGDFFELTSVSRTGFTIATKNSGGTIVDRTIDYQAVGHGKEIT